MHVAVFSPSSEDLLMIYASLLWSPVKFYCFLQRASSITEYNLKLGRFYIIFNQIYILIFQDKAWKATKHLLSSRTEIENLCSIQNGTQSTLFFCKQRSILLTHFYSTIPIILSILFVSNLDTL